MTPHETPPTDDPVLARRAAIARASAIATKAGYAAVLTAVVVFVVGFFAGFNNAVISIVVGLIVLSGLLLVPAMIFGYGAKMAERHERGEPFTY